MDKRITKKLLIWMVGIILGGLVLLVVVFLNQFRKEKKISYPKISYPIIDISEYIEMDDFVVDNSSSIDKLLTIEYNLEELETFFDTYSYIKRGAIEPPREFKSLSWDDVNIRFPIECLRYHKNSHYSIYRVKEGGFFYVFWNVPLKSTPSKYLDKECPISVLYSIHLSRLPSIKDFQPMIKLRTASDVMKIDAQMEFNFLLSSCVCSYNLLDDGKVLEIRYRRDNLVELSDLIVDEYSVVPKEESASSLSSIANSDLP